MKANTHNFPARTFFAFFLLLPAMGALAEEGELWQVEVKMEMAGMPAGMPPQSTQACLPKEQREEMALPKDASCTRTELKKEGNKTSFKVACSGKAKMTGSGEFEQQGSDRYRGKMHMVIDNRGKPLEMTQSFNGKRIGKCDYQPRT